MTGVDQYIRRQAAAACNIQRPDIFVAGRREPGFGCIGIPQHIVERAVPQLDVAAGPGNVDAIGCDVRKIRKLETLQPDIAPRNTGHIGPVGRQPAAVEHDLLTGVGAQDKIMAIAAAPGTPDVEGSVGVEMVGTLPEINDDVRGVRLGRPEHTGEEIVPGIAEGPIPIGGFGNVYVISSLG